MKIKNHKKITNLSFKFKKKYYFLENIIIWVRYFLKYILNFIIMLRFRQFDLNIPLSSMFYSSIVAKQMNSNN